MSDTKDVKQQRIIPVNIETEMKKSFIDYAMSVIVDRALPDVRDGLNLFTEEYFTQCTVLGLHRTRHIENVPQPSVKFWVNTIPTEMPRFMTVWCAWHKISR